RRRRDLLPAQNRPAAGACPGRVLLGERALAMNHAHIVCHGRDPNSHQHTWGGAFGKGLEKHGWTVTYGSATRACDLLVLWGVRRRDWIARQKAAGGEVCILERGYLGDRFFWTSVSFGGELNGRAE